MNKGSTSASATSCNANKKKQGAWHYHPIVLAQRDVNGYPISQTEFVVSLKLRRKRGQVELALPQVNFQISGAISADNAVPTVVYFAGGWIATDRNPIPKRYRPNQRRTFFGTTNDNLLPQTNYNTVTVTTVPSVFLPGMNVELDVFGNLKILGTASYTNVIPVGGHTLNPLSVKYCAKRAKPVKAQVVDASFTNVSNPLSDYYTLGVRDSHVNDAWNSITAITWTSNGLTNPSLDLMNMYVAVAKAAGKASRKHDKHGHKECDSCAKPLIPVNLTQFVNVTDNSGYSFAWDTAIAICRGSLDHCHDSSDAVYVASAGLINVDQGGAVPVYFRYANGAWSGILQLDPVTFPMNNVAEFGDCRGVLADPFGNFLYSTTLPNAITGGFDLLFYFSGDQGLTWSLAYQTNLAGTVGDFDYPQICTGVTGGGSASASGFWFCADFIPYAGAQADAFTPTLGFIPVVNHAVGAVGNGTFGDGTIQQYPNLFNDTFVSVLTCDPCGRVSLFGTNGVIGTTSNYIAGLNLIKQPPNSVVTAPLDPSLLQFGTTIDNVDTLILQPVSSFVYLFYSPNSIAYDAKRRVMWSAVVSENGPFEQSWQLQLRVNPDNTDGSAGTTWGPPIQVDSDKNNRGFQSIAVDSVTGDLVLSYYSAQNSSDGTTLQYLCARITACEADQLVKYSKKYSY